ncbi:hypothetical protein [Endozoicomonas numazuensis]|uniref:Uncharacterized protein n=1 Tax=Endozoicomonas numazuensis TaxID=1137799 RepID=A0A081NFP0_9GAMM|nr:hypothetical protein [Endozoicomonas numazuensis]KEQ17263.1 hypothetical protein GZ78_15675 [Endozoicomonas numazuensis]
MSSSPRESSRGNQAGRSVQTTEAQRTEGLSGEAGNPHPRHSRSLKDRIANSFLGKLFIRQPSTRNLEQRLQTRSSEASNTYLNRPATHNPYSEIDDNSALSAPFHQDHSYTDIDETEVSLSTTSPNENPYVDSEPDDDDLYSPSFSTPEDDGYLEPTPSSLKSQHPGSEPIQLSTAAVPAAEATSPYVNVIFKQEQPLGDFE